MGPQGEATSAQATSATLKERLRGLEERVEDFREKFESSSRLVARLEEDKARVQELMESAVKDREKADEAR